MFLLLTEHISYLFSTVSIGDVKLVNVNRALVLLLTNLNNRKQSRNLGVGVLLLTLNKVTLGDVFINC